MFLHFVQQTYLLITKVLIINLLIISDSKADKVDHEDLKKVYSNYIDYDSYEPERYLFSKHNYNVLVYLLALECGKYSPDSMFMSYFDRTEMYDSDVAGMLKIRPHRAK